jgi:hypothetical protein
MDRRELLVFASLAWAGPAWSLQYGLQRGPRDTDGPEWDRWLEEYEKCGGESS